MTTPTQDTSVRSEIVVNAPIERRALQQVYHPLSLRRGKTLERFRRYHDRIERRIWRPGVEPDWLSLHTAHQPDLAGGGHYALDRLLIVLNRRDLASARGEVQHVPLPTHAGHEDPRVPVGRDFAHERGIGRQPPVFRFTILGEQLQAPLAPGRVGWNTKPLADDPVNFRAEDQFIEFRLGAVAQRRNSLVANAEDGTARERELVVLDLLLHVLLVRMLQRNVLARCHVPQRGGSRDKLGALVRLDKMQMGIRVENLTSNVNRQ